MYTIVHFFKVLTINKIYIFSTDGIPPLLQLEVSENQRFLQQRRYSDTTKYTIYRIEKRQDTATTHRTVGTPTLLIQSCIQANSLSWKPTQFWQVRHMELTTVGLVRRLIIISDKDWMMGMSLVYTGIYSTTAIFMLHIGKNPKFTHLQLIIKNATKYV